MKYFIYMITIILSFGLYTLHAMNVSDATRLAETLDDLSDQLGQTVPTTVTADSISSLVKNFIAHFNKNYQANKATLKTQITAFGQSKKQEDMAAINETIDSILPEETAAVFYMFLLNPDPTQFKQERADLLAAIKPLMNQLDSIGKIASDTQLNPQFDLNSQQEMSLNFINFFQSLIKRPSTTLNAQSEGVQAYINEDLTKAINGLKNQINPLKNLLANLDKASENTIKQVLIPFYKAFTQFQKTFGAFLNNFKLYFLNKDLTNKLQALLIPGLGQFKEIMDLLNQTWPKIQELKTKLEKIDLSTQAMPRRHRYGGAHRYKGRHACRRKAAGHGYVRRRHKGRGGTPTPLNLNAYQVLEEVKNFGEDLPNIIADLDETFFGFFTTLFDTKKFDSDQWGCVQKLIEKLTSEDGDNDGQSPD